MAQYQLHSTDDLREWNAMFAKGVTSLKIDPHYVPGSNAFKLSHDLPKLIGQEPYSTLDDVLEYFTSSAPPSIHNQTISVALCFKSAPKDICSSLPSLRARQWNKMAKDFFISANDAVKEAKSKFDITLEFVLDGDAKPCDCKAELFQPWQSVWIETDECSFDCFTSNEGFCRRFSILNDPDSSDWESMSSDGYGKFGSNDDVSLQLWEPDYQPIITKLINNYISGRDAGVPSGKSLAFAINVDPAMFDVHSSRSSLEGTVEARGFDKVVEGSEGGTEPKLEKVGRGLWDLAYRGQDDEANVVNQIQVEEGSGLPFATMKIKSAPGTSPLHPESPLFVLNETDCHVRLNGTCICSDDAVRTSVTSATWAPLGNDSGLVAISDGGKIYAGIAKDKSEDVDWRLIGLGGRVSSTTLNDILLLSMEGNHCYNAHSYNTRSSPLVCEPQAEESATCPEILDYTVGTQENWHEWLSSSRDSEKGYVITACNDVLLHGSWGGGSVVSLDLFEVEGDDKVGVLAAYESYKSTEESVCGTPTLGVDGVIVSSFALSVVREGFEGTQAAVGVGGGTETGENLIGTNVNFGLVGALIGLLAVGTIFAGFNVWKTFSKKGANDEDGRSLIHSSSKSAVLI